MGISRLWPVPTQNSGKSLSTPAPPCTQEFRELSGDSISPLTSNPTPGISRAHSKDTTPALVGNSLDRDRPHPHLFCFPCNEVPDGLAEEAGEQGVQGGLVVQEVVEDVEQGLVPAQFVVDLRHVRGQQLAGRVGVPAVTHPEVRWELPWRSPSAKVS